MSPSNPMTLTQEERNDLRKRVLAGYSLTLDEAKAVLDSTRQGQGAAVLAGESKKPRAKKDALSDAQLDADLATLGL